jgi:hypothetical protein
VAVLVAQVEQVEQVVHLLALKHRQAVVLLPLNEQRLVVV